MRIDLTVVASTVAHLRCPHPGSGRYGETGTCGRLLLVIYRGASGEIEAACPRCHKKTRANVAFPAPVLAG